MAKRSAGLLLFRRREGNLEVLLVHPGGPFWAGKDEGVWSIPKGEYAEDDDAFAAAKREFFEETGLRAEGQGIALGEVKQAGGKVVVAWAMAGDMDPSQIRSNTFSLEWPPRSGRRKEFPEVDRGDWFSLAAAAGKIVKGQIPLLERAGEILG